jgi:arylesterase/paraoxonase
MKKKIIFSFGIISFLLAGFIVSTMYSAGVFLDIKPHFGGMCTRVDGVIGAEDITIDPDTGIAYISAMDRRTLGTSGEHIGGIYLYRPGSFTTPIKLTSDIEGPFHPHGIDLWKTSDAQNDRLFIVSHPLVDDTPTSQIDIFEIADNHLRHVRTVKPSEPISLNDVAATGPDSFYVSIDQGSVTPLGRTLERYGRLARAGVMYGNGQTMQKVQGDMIYANGMQVSPDGTLLYVAETTGKHLSVFEINELNGSLTPVDDIKINSGLDNIELDADGTMWIVGHPKTFAFLAHAGDALKRSPSQIFKVRRDDNEFSVSEIYLNDGNPISGASVAAPYGNRFLVGSVFEPFILDCELPAE